MMLAQFSAGNYRLFRLFLEFLDSSAVSVSGFGLPVTVTFLCPRFPDFSDAECAVQL